ncbi:hypothetical protein EIP91_003686 [Steccherinum ochraceum]|uniref:Uncharacterized protein n=1 Tax=Steccherinum ochraceum TaxID=92696 RepID=A0A4R0RA24_9APHY|nr:hypothetical protein EIP91_003686 [Steccherinum ochraceum]
MEVETARDLSALSRNIQELRDSFRSLVKVAHGGWPDQSLAATPIPRMQRLGTMCARLIGEYLEEEVNSSVGNGDEKMIDDGANLDALEELYEDIPQHYRRYAMVSHALKYILDQCPHYPTLLWVLLDVTVAFRLVAQTERLIHELCLAAFCLNSKGPEPLPQISSSLCGDHFIALYDKCCGSGPNAYPLITNASFAAIVASAASQSPTPSLAIWKSSPVITVVRDIRDEEFPTFTRLATVLAHEAAKSKHPDNLVPHLQTWLMIVFNHLISHDASTTNQAQDDFAAVVEFLLAFPASRLFKRTTSSTLADYFLSLTVYCLALPVLGFSSPETQKSLRDVVKDSSPVAGSYDLLATKIILKSELFSSSPSQEIVLPDVASWACVLRSHSLCRHEALFCSSVLSRVERLLRRAPSSSTSAQNRMIRALETMRDDLVVRIEEAERLSFNQSAEQDVNMDPTQWRWEDLTGCWIRQSPIVDRRKKPKTHRELAGIGLGLVPKAPSSTSSSSSTSSFSRSSMSPEADDDYTPPSSPSPSVASQHSRSPGPSSGEDLLRAYSLLHPQTASPIHFDTMLADAHSHCTMLHAADTRGPIKPRERIFDRSASSLNVDSLRSPDRSHASSDDLALSYSSPMAPRSWR